MKKIISKTKKGFTMMEVLLASFVLTSGIVAVLALITNGTVQSIDSRDSIIASELAQEGIELVKNERDNDMLGAAAGTYVFSGLPAANQTDCRVDYNSDLDCGFGADVNNYSLYRSGSGFYNNDGIGTATKFRRIMSIENIFGGGGAGRRIRSIVTWDGTIKTFDNCDVADSCIATESILMNWK